MVKILNRTGAEHRYLRDMKKGETAHQHILGAMQNSLEKANLSAVDIDILIYCGVGKGFIEPSNAYLYAKEMQMDKAEGFDVVDACMSWTRAIQICQKFLKAKTCERIMVVTG